MKHKDALKIAISHIQLRIGEFDEMIAKAKATGDENLRVSARNFQNGLIECHNLLQKLAAVADACETKPEGRVYVAGKN